MKTVIIGGSGYIGTKLVKHLHQLRRHCVSASPTSGIDTLTGSGLKEALKDAQVVIDVTNPRSFEGAAAMYFFDTPTRNLLSAGAETHVQHHIVLSVVGADRMSDIGYMRTKVAQEKLVRLGPISRTIVRATQFVEFVDTIVDLGAEGATARLPPVLMQPIAADDVVAFLIEVTDGAPFNNTIDLAGPEKVRMDVVARGINNRCGNRKKAVATSRVTKPGRVDPGTTRRRHRREEAEHRGWR